MECVVLQEGRKIWENILSISRNLSRLVHLYGKEIGTKRKGRILKLVAAYPYLLRHHIRPGCLCSQRVVDADYRLRLCEPSQLSEPRECFVDRRELPWSLFTDKSLPMIALTQNRPLWVCDRIGRELMSIQYGPNFTSRERLTMLSQVDKLTNAVGQCERIQQTAVPLNYASHSLRSLTLWLFSLPFVLIKDMGLLTGPAVAVVAWALFGVYQIGHTIEDPFQGSIRLSVLCDAIRRDVIGDDENAAGDRASRYALEDVWDDPTESKHKLQQQQPPKKIAPLNLLQEDAFLNSAPRLIQENDGLWNVVGVVEG